MIEEDENGWSEGHRGMMSRKIIRDGQICFEGYTDPLKKAAAASRMGKSPEEVLAALHELFALTEPEEGMTMRETAKKLMARRLDTVAVTSEYHALIYSLLYHRGSNEWAVNVEGRFLVFDYIPEIVDRYKKACRTFLEAMLFETNPAVVMKTHLNAFRWAEELMRVYNMPTSEKYAELSELINLLPKLLNGWTETTDQNGITYLVKEAA